MTSLVGVLAEIVARTRQRIGERSRERPLEALRAQALGRAQQRRHFAAALSRPGRISVIAEFKRRSPSRGVIREDLSPATVARGYAAAGAAALSVLTEPDSFGGSLGDLQQARAACELPVLRKDFLVDAYQVWEAAAAGADAVLLIVACLDPAGLERLIGESAEACVEALVEVHDDEELRRALAAGARLVGVNNRDLRTMRVSLETAAALAQSIPDGVVAVAESGIRTGEDVRRLREAGYDAFLVGEHLMQAPDPGAALSVLIEQAGAGAAGMGV